MAYFIIVWVHRVVLINVSYIKHPNSLLCLCSPPHCWIQGLRGYPQDSPCCSKFFYLLSTAVKPDIPGYAYTTQGSAAEKHLSQLRMGRAGLKKPGTLRYLCTSLSHSAEICMAQHVCTVQGSAAMDSCCQDH